MTNEYKVFSSISHTCFPSSPFVRILTSHSTILYSVLNLFSFPSFSKLPTLLNVVAVARELGAALCSTTALWLCKMIIDTESPYNDNVRIIQEGSGGAACLRCSPPSHKNVTQRKHQENQSKQMKYSIQLIGQANSVEPIRQNKTKQWINANGEKTRLVLLLCTMYFAFENF